jgi:hypothetical protein
LGLQLGPQKQPFGFVWFGYKRTHRRTTAGPMGHPQLQGLAPGKDQVDRTTLGPRTKRTPVVVGCELIWCEQAGASSNLGGSPNCTAFRPPNCTPSTGSPPSRWLYQPPAAIERAGGAPLTPQRAPGAPKWAREPRNGTQEIAQSFWYLFYGDAS